MSWSFQNPQMLYLLYGLPCLIALFVYFYYWRKQALNKLGKPKMHTWLMTPQQPWMFWCRMFLLCASYACITIALAKPQGLPLASKGNEKAISKLSKRLNEKTPQSMKRIAQEIIFVVDTSASMQVKDMRGDKSRLAVAKEIIDNTLQQLQGERVSLYAFTSELTLVVPPTTDYFFVKLMLQHMDLNMGDVAGTDFVEVFDQLKQKYWKAPSLYPKTLCFFTDGGDTRIESLAKGQKEKEEKLLIQMLEGMDKGRVSLEIMGMGTAEGQVVPNVDFKGKPVVSNLAEGLLKTLAKEGGGDYIYVDKTSALSVSQSIYRKVEQYRTYEQYSQELEKVEVSQSRKIPRQQYVHWPILAAVGMLCIERYLFTRRKSK